MHIELHSLGPFGANRAGLSGTWFLPRDLPRTKTSVSAGVRCFRFMPAYTQAVLLCNVDAEGVLTAAVAQT